MNISQIQKQWELGPHSAINEIFRLVEKYGVDATIDQAKGTVSFRSKESGSGTSIYHVAQREKEIALSVADEMKNLTNISAQMQSLFDQIQVSSRALNQIDSESGKDGM
ncbi:MAG: hypothetical protein EZS28_050926 [Streblomastix strix]|nr:MAG: hypothetical protein EZS28_050926 [Streblomastix strix]